MRTVIRHTLMPVAMACTALFALSGCGEKIDARQLENNQGLLYKHGDTDPFTGVADNLEASYGFDHDLGTDGINPPKSCTLKLSKGVLDGKTVCQGGNGSESAEFNYKDGQKNGKEKVYGADGELLLLKRWDEGRLVAEEDYFPGSSTKSKQMAWSESNGETPITGTEKRWDKDGQVVYDYTLKKGRAVGCSYAAFVNGPTFECTTGRQNRPPLGGPEGFNTVMVNGSPINPELVTDGERKGSTYIASVQSEFLAGKLDAATIIDKAIEIADTPPTQAELAAAQAAAKQAEEQRAESAAQTRAQTNANDVRGIFENACTCDTFKVPADQAIVVCVQAKALDYHRATKSATTGEEHEAEWKDQCAKQPQAIAASQLRSTAAAPTDANGDQVDENMPPANPYVEQPTDTPASPKR